MQHINKIKVKENGVRRRVLLYYVILYETNFDF
jgi:hypothetical protein